MPRLHMAEILLLFARLLLVVVPDEWVEEFFKNRLAFLR
jgi:hypothetical protein